MSKPLSEKELEDLVEVLYFEWISDDVVCPICNARLYRNEEHKADCLLWRWLDNRDA